MASYSVAVAKSGLPDLIDRARSGERVVITDGGRPVAELRPVVEEAAGDAQPEPKTRAEWNEWMRKRRDAGPRITITSVELLNGMYEESPW